MKCKNCFVLSSLEKDTSWREWKITRRFQFSFLLFSKSETTVLSIMLKQEGKTSESDGKADSRKFEIKKNKMSKEEEKEMEKVEKDEVFGKEKDLVGYYIFVLSNQSKGS